MIPSLYLHGHDLRREVSHGNPRPTARVHHVQTVHAPIGGDEMKVNFKSALAALLASIVTANAQQAPDPRVKDLVQAGRVRVALFLPQFTKNPVTGEIRGDVHLVETARALAARLGVELVLVDYPTPTKAVEGLKVGACDVGFLGINPSRATDVGFSPPLVELVFTYLAPAG